MAKLLKLRRGTTTQHGSFTGAEGEVTVDTDKEALVVHNGSTAGGFPVARADGTGVTNFTISGELDAATLDISGNADIDGNLDVDGTLEADAYTVDGTALNEYIADTVGAMVGSNTETGIAVTYEDSDNTLDFSITSIPGVTFTGDVIFTGDAATITFDKSTDDLIFNDNAKAIFGTLSDGLEIYHDASNSYIKDSGTGGLFIQGESQILLGDSSDGDHYIIATKDGSVDLYHNNVKKIETTATGIDVTGTVTTDELTVKKASGNLGVLIEADNGLGTMEIGGSTGAFIDLKTPISDDFDLRVNADGTLTSVGNISLKVKTNEEGINITQDGAVDLYHDNIKTVSTIANGINVTGTEAASAYIELFADEGDDNGDKWRVESSQVDNKFKIQHYGAGSWVTETELDSSGNLVATGNVTAYSDARLKTDVDTIENALDKVTKLRGVSYTKADTQERGIGVIAQEIEEVIPEVVQDGAYKSVAYGNIVGVLIEAIKELKSEIDELKGGK